jgi:cytochrome o ubiquinol oxidase operon protein cyoD
MFDKDYGWNTTFKPLNSGLVISLLLLMGSYFIVTRAHLKYPEHDIVLWGLAGLQALIQLVLFTHLGVRAKPRWPMISFLMMVLLVLIVVVGTLWITSNLNYNMMPDMKGMQMEMKEMPNMDMKMESGHSNY